MCLLSSLALLLSAGTTATVVRWLPNLMDWRWVAVLSLAALLLAWLALAPVPRADRRESVRARRPLWLVGAGLVAIAGVLLPEPRRAEWCWSTGPAVGDLLCPRWVTSWSGRHLALELLATPGAPREPDHAWWQAQTDLAGLARGCRPRVKVYLTVPEDAVLDPQTGAVRLGAGGMQVTFRAVGGDDDRTLTEVTLDPWRLPEQRRWHRVLLDVPRGTERVRVEARMRATGDSLAPARVWLDVLPPEPLLFGRPMPPDGLRVARGLTFAFGLLVVLWLGSLIGRRRLTPASAALLEPEPQPAGAWAVAAAVFATACVLYYPLVAAKYGFGDDYFFFYSAHHNPADLVQMVSACGRFISAALLRFGFALVENVAQFSVLRGIGAVALALSLALLAVFLIRRGWSAIQAVAIALLVGAAPSACLAVGWTQMLPVPMALLLTLLAYALQQRVGWPLTWGGAACGLGAVAALSAAFCIYQPWAMFYWLWLILDHLPTGRPRAALAALRSGLRAMGVFGAGAIVAYLSIKLQRAPNPRAGLATDFLAKLRWFGELPLCNASASPWLAPCEYVTGAAAAVVVLGFLCYWMQGRRGAALGVLAMLVALPVVYLPNLAITDNWPAYRSLFALTALITVLVVFALRGVLTRPAVLSGVLVILAAIGLCVFTYQGRTSLSAPLVLELKLLQQPLRRATPGQVTGIHVIQPVWSDTAAVRVLYDEFGLPTTTHFWAPPSVVWAAAQDLDPQHRVLGDLPVTNAVAPLAPPPPSVLQIDMRGLSQWRDAIGG